MKKKNNATVKNKISVGLTDSFSIFLAIFSNNDIIYVVILDWVKTMIKDIEFNEKLARDLQQFDEN